MPILNWIGKDAVVNHDKDVPFRLLKKIKSASVGAYSQNLILHGDNLEALKALMPFYYGKIQCIYIDPPYNTGTEKWVFNDKVNSPKIKAWIKKVVGPEGTDLSRHDKWLCMMYPRVKLLKDLLFNKGVLFISIDEHELTNVCYLVKDLFGENSYDILVWRKTGKQSNTKAIRRIKTTHEYIVVVYKDKQSTRLSKVKLLPNWKNKYTNPDKDPRGVYKQGIISNKEETSREASVNYYPVILPSGRVVTREWYISKDEFDRLHKDDRIYYPKNGDGIPAVKIFENEEQEYYFDSIIDEMGTFSDAKQEIEDIFGDRDAFDTPKPTKLIKEIIRCSTKDGDIVMDSFAGSGTTGQAVLELNREDGKKRKFILVEMEDHIAKEKTVTRIKNAIQKNKCDDGFEFCELSKPLFDEEGQIEKTCDFGQFATYIYFTETQTNIDLAKVSGNFIGEHTETEYYLIYKEKGVNVIGKSFLKKLRKNDSIKVVYADKCMLDEATLENHNVVFKQIPYEVKVY